MRAVKLRGSLLPFHTKRVPIARVSSLKDLPCCLQAAQSIERHSALDDEDCLSLCKLSATDARVIITESNVQTYDVRERKGYNMNWKEEGVRHSIPTLCCHTRVSPRKNSTRTTFISALLLSHTKRPFDFPDSLLPLPPLVLVAVPRSIRWKQRVR